MNRRSLQRKRPASQRSDKYYTPESALVPIVKYLRPFKTIWDPAAGAGHITKFFKKEGFDVIGTDIEKNKSHDFLTTSVPDKCDVIMTNPPFSLKKQFIERCFELRKPFMLLVPLNCLETQGVRRILAKQKFSIVYPTRNIDYILSNARPGQVSRAFFYSVYLTNIPKIKPYEFIDPPEA